MSRRDFEKDLFVVKLSGSLFFSDEFDEMVSALDEIFKAKNTLRAVLVAGGGPNARKYIEVAKKHGTDQASLDEIGIQVSRLNALVLAASLGPLAFGSVPTSLARISSLILQAKRATTGGPRIVVCGGLYPGQSTNAVAALIAEKIKAQRLVNATDVDGVYDKDPRKYNDAKLLKRVSTDQLSRILGEESMQAGGYDLMDPIALKLIQRSKIQTTILKCSPKVLRSFLVQNRKTGTEVEFFDS